MAPNRKSDRHLFGKAAKRSALFFLFDRLANDVGHVGVALFLFLDESSVVEALVAHLDLFLFTRVGGGVSRSRLLALLLGLGVLERYEFGVRGLRSNGFRRRGGPCRCT